MISKTYVVTQNQFDSLRLITIHMIQTCPAHIACNEIHLLFKTQITKTFCKAMFTIGQFISEGDVDIIIIENKQSFYS